LKATAACEDAGIDFNNIKDVQYYLSPEWYKSKEMLIEFMARTGLNE
jgi:hypothetical protein